jgi:hypothetical protein
MNGHTSANEMGMAIEPPADNEEAPAVDLAAWAAGEVEYPFAEVQRAIDDYILRKVDKWVRDRFPLMVTTPREAVRFLVQERLIAKEDARDDVDEDE